MESSQPVQQSEFVAVVKEPAKNGKVLIEMRNRFKIGDTLKILSPNDSFGKEIVVKSITDINGKAIEDADKVQALLYINCDYPLSPLDILRR